MVTLKYSVFYLGQIMNVVNVENGVFLSPRSQLSTTSIMLKLTIDYAVHEIVFSYDDRIIKNKKLTLATIFSNHSTST